MRPRERPGGLRPYLAVNKALGGTGSYAVKGDAYVGRYTMKTKNIRSISQALLVFAVVVLAGVNAVRAADKELKPYVLGSVETGSLGTVAMEVKQALVNQGFEVAGEYPPYEGAYVIVVTNDTLKENAARSEMGGFGAIQRIGLTKTEQGVQVSYTNPPYMANAYRMENDLESVAQDLEVDAEAAVEVGVEGAEEGGGVVVEIGEDDAGAFAFEERAGAGARRRVGFLSCVQRVGMQVVSVGHIRVEA